MKESIINLIDFCVAIACCCVGMMLVSISDWLAYEVAYFNFTPPVEIIGFGIMFYLTGSIILVEMSLESFIKKELIKK